MKKKKSPSEIGPQMIVFAADALVTELTGHLLAGTRE